MTDVTGPSYGRLVIVSAPSGTGKSTIVRALLQSELNLHFSVSACNRPPRPKEVNGVDYHFLSPEDFARKIREGAFLEWEEVYPGRFYGSLRSDVEALLAEGKNVIFDVDVVGGLNIKKAYGPLALAIILLPPSIKVLEERLRMRGTEDEAELQVRLEKAEEEIAFAPRFDLQIINEDLRDTIPRTKALITRFLEQEKPRQ